jgi:hypothetical protein
MDGFSTTLGSTGKDVDEEVLAAVTLILQNNKAIGPYVVVMHPYCWYPFIKSTANTLVSSAYGSSAASLAEIDAKVQQFYIGRMPMFGTTLWHDSNIPIDTGANNDTKSGAFGREALCITTSMEEVSEIENDASLRGVEVVHVLDFGVAELLDTSGVEMHFAADTPAPAGD